MYLVFTGMPVESYCRWFRRLLCSCEVLGVVVGDCFYIALFSALEQTHCAHM